MPSTMAPATAEAAPPWLAWLPEQARAASCATRSPPAFCPTGRCLILPGPIFVETLPMLGLSRSPGSRRAPGRGRLSGRAQRAAVAAHQPSHHHQPARMTIAAIGGAVIIGVYRGRAGHGALPSARHWKAHHERARQSIRSLMEVAPAEALVLAACIDCQGHMGMTATAAAVSLLRRR